MQTETGAIDSAPRVRRLGKYELIARIGNGGMAEVYLARQLGPMNFEKVVVVKTIHPHLAQQREFIDMLLDEARIAARLKHPCVVDIYDLGVDGNTYFIAMEHLAGQSLLSILRAGVKGKPLEVRSVARIMADVADGLHAAHELKDLSGRSLDLVHRDITPGNIVVLYTGQVKIVDFGIAKARGRMAEDTGAQHFKGKLGYVSPEQIDNEDVDRRSDIFALGVVMWEALAMRRLFRQKTPEAVAHAIMNKEIEPPSKYRPEVPPKLDSICLRALARNRDERYATAAEMYEDIEKFLSAATFRSPKAEIVKYMQEHFAEEMAEREALLRRVVEATGEIRVEPGAHRLGTGGELTELSAEIILLPADSTQAEAAITQPSGEIAIPREPGSMDDVPSGERVPGTVPRFQVMAQVAQRNTRRWAVLASAVLLIGIIAIGVMSADDAPPAASANRGTPAAEAGQKAASSETAQPDTAGAALVAAMPVNGSQAGQSDAAASAASDSAGSQGTGQDTGEAGDTNPDTSATATGEDEGKDKDEGKNSASSSSSSSKPSSKPARKQSPEELYKQGVSHYVGGKMSSARSKFQAAIDANPRYAEAYRGLGMVYERTGNKRKASWAFRQYLRLAPSARDSASIRKRLAALE